MDKLVCVALVGWLAAAWSETTTAQGDVSAGPVFNAAGELMRPDYREWVFLASSLGMTYGPEAQAAGRTGFFQNIYVTRDAYRTFMKSGTWPDKTMFILEGRQPLEHVSINNAGRTQGDVVFVEAAVKDVKRFTATNGWAYFGLGAGQRARASAAALPATESCYACHATHTAVDNTFVQFYPELFAQAKKLGTIRKDWDPARKAFTP